MRRHKTITGLKSLSLQAFAGLALTSAPALAAGPEDDLPANITQLTSFGKRASWSPDGRSIAFMSKSYGDAFVVDVDTRKIRLLTHFPNPGFLRVQYLPNGDYLLIGARTYDNFDKTRYSDQEFWLLKASDTRKPIALNEKVSEGVAISRSSMKIAWAVDSRTSPQDFAEGESGIYIADIRYDDGQPRLVNKKLVLREKLPGCRLEAQDFRNNDRELTYVCYRETSAIRLADVFGLDLQTGASVTYRKVPSEYNEVEGIYPNGQYTLVESSKDQPQPRGSKTIDIWKLRLEPNSPDFTRLTRFGDYPGYKSSNPVVSPDGSTIAFQEGRSTDTAGVGYGIFLLKER